MNCLDLFCGAGGCSVGYKLAGADSIVGIDINPQPRYPFKFVNADAFEFLKKHGHKFDFIHASPPCQGYSENMKHLHNGTAPKLIDECRELLCGFNCQWVIENVEGAPLATESGLFGDHGVMLCGSMFGLRIWRHRLFETSFPIVAPCACHHTDQPLNPHREESRHRMRQEFGQVDLEKIWRQEAGVPWMNKEEGRQAIPPVYTKFIFSQALAFIEKRIAV